ncbi:MAPKK kinase 20, mitogen-activated protein kinase kinase kinase 20 [Hibiscus trionum]|uniref:MAPKK kinase 20, mitogen-activated protein kinase kinase kinase 20 n=1 Tax=Hibiscus trionum TaxID=183268 RepID=A0A9W7LM52_HIBTR|nr:MAPKK kinase 20, mitogen-activated protein kinase kinase kinase 20 [Hibiscus trionum]
MTVDSVVKGINSEGVVVEWTKVKALGSGSYGQVHLVKFPTLVSSYHFFAVKSSVYSRSDSIQKELHILQEFYGCNNIVRCYGGAVSIEKGVQFYNLFLEYASHGTLLDLIEKYGGKIPEQVVKCYTKMLLEGLRCIHTKGYVHCDLKPENILVFSRCGTYVILKIADFGLVRRVNENYVVKKMPKKIRFPGTPLYMPPETVVGDKISCALDIWSLGCIVLQMITGKRPWEHTEDKMDLAVKILCSRCPPNKIPKTLSSEGKDFLTKCFTREPSERWTADMLLSHPFITPTQEECDDCLPSIEEIEARLSDFL